MHRQQIQLPWKNNTLKVIWHLSVHVQQFNFLSNRAVFKVYICEKNISTNVMRHVKIVILILKNCLVIHERFKWHILCFELNTMENNYVILRGDLPCRHLYITVAADVHISWKKVKSTRCLYSTDMALYNIKMINTLYKQR